MYINSYMRKISNNKKIGEEIHLFSYVNKCKNLLKIYLILYLHADIMRIPSRYKLNNIIICRCGGMADAPS